MHYWKNIRQTATLALKLQHLSNTNNYSYFFYLILLEIEEQKDKQITSRLAIFDRKQLLKVSFTCIYIKEFTYSSAVTVGCKSHDLAVWVMLPHILAVLSSRYVPHATQ